DEKKNRGRRLVRAPSLDVEQRRLDLVTPVVAVVVIVAVMTIAAVVSGVGGGNGTASAGHPNTPSGGTPRLGQDNRRDAAVSREANAAVGVHAAAVDIEIVGSAIESADAAVAVIVRIFIGADGKVSPTATVHPNVVACNAPSAPIDAGGFTPLTKKFDATIGVDRAKVAIEV